MPATSTRAWTGTSATSRPGFAEADLVREQRFVGNRTYQSPMEPHAALARWEHHGERLTLWSSTQTPHYLHRSLSRMLGIPMGNIRVIRPAVGGGFGAKAEATPLDFCAAILAQAHRPSRGAWSTRARRCTGISAAATSSTSISRSA